MEPATCHEPLGEKEGASLATRFRVRCTTRGKRLGDVDGRSIKAVLDGFTKAGIWPDDNAESVVEVSFRQEKHDNDETIIEIFTEA